MSKGDAVNYVALNISLEEIYHRETIPFTSKPQLAQSYQDWVIS